MARSERTLHFSIQGDFITNLAREKLYVEHDYEKAVELLMSCLCTDELTEDARVGMAIKILDGKLKIVGCYPGDDYGVEDTTEEERKSLSTIGQYLAKRNRKIEALSKEHHNLLAKYLFIAENLSTHQVNSLTYMWENQGISEEPLFGFRLRQQDDDRGAPLISGLLDSYLKQARIEKDFDDNYGWLAPDGTFYPVDWGEHQGWAFDKAQELYPDETPDINDCCSGDILIRHHWVLLHSPSMGVAWPQYDETRNLTKKQSEFLYEYYADRGLDDMAQKYLRDV